MTHLRIAQVIPAIAVEASGPSYSVVRLCESLIARGEQVVLAALRWDERYSPPPFCREFPLSRGPRKLGRSARMSRWLVEECTAGRIDLLHSHALWMMPCVYPGRLARNSNVPLVTSPRGSLSPEALGLSRLRKKAFWLLQQGQALRAARLLHATSEAEYADIRAAGLTQPVAVIPNGIDIPPPRPPRSAKRRRVLLYLGRVHPIKGLDVLLRAWHELSARHVDWDLRIVGPGEPAHVTAVRQHARDLGVQRVNFAGAAYGPERLAAYQSADLYVLPTRSENFGMTVAEALAAGTPVITTHGAPWAGLARHDAGWWIEQSLDALVATLDLALRSSPERLEAMGANGRLWMTESFGWPTIGAAMQSVYQWLVHRGDKPGCIYD